MNTSISNKNKNKEKQKGFTRSVRLAEATSSRASGTSASSTAGFTLIETLVAISIFVASVTALLVVTGDGIKNTNSAQNRLTATYLAQEGAELIRAARDSYFLEQAYYKTQNPIVPEPDMRRLTLFCDPQNGGPGAPAYDFCHGPVGIPWIYKPGWLVDHSSADPEYLAGPLGPCKRSDAPGVPFAGTPKGCNINFQLQTQPCTEKMHLAAWENVDVDGNIPDKRAKFAAEKCAEYFLQQGIFRPRWLVSYNDDGTIDTDNDLDIGAEPSGFVRQIFVEPEMGSLDDDASDPTGGLRVTVRVYWIEGHKLLNVRVDDFLTAWPGKVVQGTTTP